MSCESANIPCMEADLAGAVFEGVTILAARYKDDWLVRWAPQDGRFRPTPAADGAPANGRWEMIYWLRGGSQDAQTAAQLLERLGVGYEVVYDTQEDEFVVLTDYVVPTLMGVDR